MRICRILTNNALVVLDEKGKEQIVCGKGIGYKKRPGDNVDDKLVETVYVKEGDQSFEQIRRTLEALPEEYLLLAQHIVEAANVSLNMKLNPVMAVSLADHLFYAIQRFLEGTPIANSLTWEIKRFYQKEYEVGLMALDMVESQFKVRLPESEAAFIAMHIANGETDDSTMEETFAITKIIEDKLLEVDINSIHEKGYSLETPVLVTNADDYADVIEMASGSVKAGAPLLTALK